MGTKSKTVPFYRVIVIGGGFAGLGAAIKLKQAGIQDFILLEKADELGGVWRENTYPAVLVMFHSLYSYSFEPNPAWSRVFAGQAEIKQYLQNTAQKYQVLPHVHFNHEALAATWSDAKQCWIIKTNQGELHSQFAIMAWANA
jgi:cation diffusion facilitator CzcD-associated flavoprotein CzcO